MTALLPARETSATWLSSARHARRFAPTQPPRAPADTLAMQTNPSPFDFEARIIGRDGNTYTTEEVDEARRLAALGDPAGQALVDNLLTDPAEITDPKAFMRALLHDCPECRAAMERGEEPIFGDMAELMAKVPARRRTKAPPGANRWRTRTQRR